MGKLLTNVLSSFVDFNAVRCSLHTPLDNILIILLLDNKTQFGTIGRMFFKDLIWEKIFIVCSLIKIY